MNKNLDELMAQHRYQILNEMPRMSDERNKAAVDFLFAWTEWDKVAKTHDVWKKIPTLLMVPLFPAYVIWMFYWNRRCDELYKEVERTQKVFNQTQ